MQVHALERMLSEYGIDADEFPPALVATAMQGLAFAMTYDQASGWVRKQPGLRSGPGHVPD
jgi:hypothetical protein